VPGARTIVAVNPDPDAPIQSEADYCVLDDLYRFVPALLSALTRLRPADRAGAPPRAQG
jgi:electron transfer flavoprotein alpha subunit